MESVGQTFLPLPWKQKKGDIFGNSTFWSQNCSKLHGIDLHKSCKNLGHNFPKWLLLPWKRGCLGWHQLLLAMAILVIFFFFQWFLSWLISQRWLDFYNAKLWQLNDIVTMCSLLLYHVYRIIFIMAIVAISGPPWKIVRAFSQPTLWTNLHKTWLHGRLTQGEVHSSYAKSLKIGCAVAMVTEMWKKSKIAYFRKPLYASQWNLAQK